MSNISEQELRQIHILRDLGTEELRHLTEMLRERKAPKGSFILYADDPGPSLFFILEGEVKVTLLSDDGKEIVLAYLGAGDFFGEIALLTGEERSANVVALSECRLFVLSKEDFDKHVLSNSGLAVAILRELAVRLRAATSKIGDLALYDVYQRVARSLHQLAEEQIIDGKAVKVITKRPTHQELASIVGTSREMVTRALKGLESEGFLKMDGKRIEIRKRRP